MKIPYGVSNFTQLRKDGYFYVDKTPFLPVLEDLGPRNLLFSRPRRMGKSLFVSLLEHYYDACKAQSEPVASREAFLDGISELGRRYPDAASVPPPAGLRGVCLWPTSIDVWHSSPSDRLHDRRLFTRNADGWTFETLVP